MSIAGEIIAAASEIAGHDVSEDYGNTIVSAIDALADACAGEDVEAGTTIAEAIKKLAPYVGGGGGGGGFEVGRPGSVALKVNDSYTEPATLVACTQKNGSVITYVNIGPDTGDAIFAQGVYVMGVIEGMVPTSCTYRVGDDGTPQQGDTFVWTTWNMPAFGFVMPDATENDLGTFVEITAEGMGEQQNPGGGGLIIN